VNSRVTKSSAVTATEFKIECKEVVLKKETTTNNIRAMYVCNVAMGTISKKKQIKYILCHVINKTSIIMIVY